MTQLEPPTAPVIIPSGTQPKKPFYKRVWFLVLTGLLIIGIFAPKSSDSKSTNPTSTTHLIPISTTALPTTTVPEPLWTEILNSTSSPLDLSNSLCSDLDSVIKKQAKIIKDRLSATSKPSEDAFDSADYLKTIDWATFEHRTNIVAQQHAVTDPQLVRAASSNPTEEQLAQFLERHALYLCPECPIGGGTFGCELAGFPPWDHAITRKQSSLVSKGIPRIQGKWGRL